MDQYIFGHEKQENKELVPVQVPETIESEAPKPIKDTKIIEKSQPKRYRVCSINQLKIYKHPTKESAVIGGLNHDTVISSLDIRNGWIKIRYKDTTGWIAKNRTVEV